MPVTNLYRDEILAGDDLPIYHAAYTPCFRREAGAAGKDTRGLLRVHQFDKVEMVKFVRPERAATSSRRSLATRRRCSRRSSSRTAPSSAAPATSGFAQAKGYDIEAWSPGVGRSGSRSAPARNYTDFQARRMNLRYRPSRDARPELLHTLNGSGLGLSRTYAALLETHLQADGSILLPAALRPHFGTDRIT